MKTDTVPPMSEQQRAEEKSSLEVSQVLTNLDHALARARKALAVVQKTGVDQNAELALRDLIAELQASRKRFVQGTYYAVETRMF